MESSYERRVQQQFDTAASGYDQGDSYAFHQPLAARVVELCQARPGEHLLDLASGTGLASLPLAQLVGPQGSVTALDLSAEMLNKQRGKAEEHGLGNISFVQGDAASVELPGCYDLIVCCSALPYFRDIPYVLRRCKGWLRDGPDSRLAFQCFESPQNPEFGLLCDMAQAAGLPLPEPNVPCGSEAACGDLCKSAGFVMTTCVAEQRTKSEIADSAEQYAQSIWRRAVRSAFWPVQAAESLAGGVLDALEEAYVAAATSQAERRANKDTTGRTIVVCPYVSLLLSSRADLFVLSASFCMGLEKGLSSLCGSSPELDLGATWNSSPSSSVMSSGHVHAWLWQRHDFSDVKLHVIGAAEGSDEQAGVSLYTLPLHSLVLASASPGHFRPEFLRRQEETRPHSDCGEGHKPAEGSRSPGTSTDKTPDKASDSPPQAPLQASGAGDAKTRPGENEVGGKRSVQAVVPSCTWQLCPVYTWTLRLLPGEPQSVPQAVLCHVYTGELPDDPETLIWMIQRADYLDLADTVRRCLDKLQSMDRKQLTLQHIVLLSTQPDLQTSTALDRANRDIIDTHIQQLTDDVLIAQMPSALDVLATESLLAQFVQLPLPLVKRWVGLDELRLDSGNTLAVLFSAWYDAQPATPTDEQCKELSAMVPMASFTVCFHLQALPHLKWWRMQKRLGGHSGTLHALAAWWAKDPDLRAWWAEEAGAHTLKNKLIRTTTRNWLVTYTQITQLWANKRLQLDSFCFGGYQLGLCLELTQAKDDKDKTGPWFLGMRNTIEWPSVLQKHGVSQQVPELVAHLEHTFTVELLYGAPHPRKWSKHDSTWLDGWGWSDLFKCRFQRLDDLAPAPGSQLTIDLTVKQPVLPGP